MSDLVLPDHLRQRLATPWGPIHQTGSLAAALHGAEMVLAVGDVVSMTLREVGITPKLFICDYQTQRGGHSPTYEAVLGQWGAVELRVSNPAATVSRQAWDAIDDAIRRPEAPVRIVVDGEEDLLGIPCFLEAPDGAVVVYGAPGKGIVVCRVDAALRHQVQELVDQMTVA